MNGIFPAPINEIMQLYNRVKKFKSSNILAQEMRGPQDVVSISEEAKKKQVIKMVKNEVLERLRK